METGTAYSYLINSIENLKFNDITYISTDYILRLSAKQKELLYDGIKISKFSKGFEKTPQTEAQFHAYIHENAQKTRKALFGLLNEETVDLNCFQDIAIVDYDCGVGLHTMLFIDYLISINRIHTLKEIILIEENSFCLERAELIIKSLIPNAVVTTINKNGNSVTINETLLEHAIVYNLACSGYTKLNQSIINNAFEGGRYLFAKLIQRKNTILGETFSHNPYTLSFYSNSDYSISERFDFDSAIVPVQKRGERDYFEWLNAPSDVYDDLNAEDDDYINTIKSILTEKDASEFTCYQSSKNASDRCILAKLNYIVCLIKGIGCKPDHNQAETLLKEINGKYNGKIQRIIIKYLGVCCKDKYERIGYLNTYLGFDLSENEKCGRRCDLAACLSDIDKEKSEILFKLCVQYGCNTCGEASNYDLAIKHCPRAQFRLSELIAEKDPEESLRLLKDSAAQGYKLALNPLGCYYFNKCKGEEREKATELFIQAAGLGVSVAARNAYLCLERKNPTKALWFIALAYNLNEQRAKDDIVSLIPRVVSGKRGEQLVDEQVVKNAEGGLSKYKEQAINILLKRVRECQKIELYYDAFKALDRLESLDADLAKQKREELEEVTPDWYYEQNEEHIDDYSREDSLMDALDGQPDAYWNID